MHLRFGHLAALLIPICGMLSIATTRSALSEEPQHGNAAGHQIKIVRHSINRRDLGPSIQDINNPNFSAAALISARAVPAYNGNRFIGYKIIAVNERSLFGRLGIRDGDIVLSINGKPCRAPGKVQPGDIGSDTGILPFPDLDHDSREDVEVMRHKEHIILRTLIRD